MLLFHSCDGKADFKQPLFQSSVSHDPLEIILNADLIFSLLSSMLNTIMLVHIFVEIMIK